jgi:hypothetical protein
MKQSVKTSILVSSLLLAGTLTIVGIGSLAAEKASGSKDAAVERTRQEVKMLDDLYKNVIVLVNEHYVNKPSDFPAATTTKEVFAAMKKNGWMRCGYWGLPMCWGTRMTRQVTLSNRRPQRSYLRAARHTKRFSRRMESATCALQQASP